VQPINLIPAPRRQARARRARLRSWGVVLVFYTAAVLAGYAACYALKDDESEAMLRESRQASDDVRDCRQEMRRLGVHVAAVERELTATRAVAQHPDWSLLLAVLAKTLSDEVVLEYCALTPVEEEPPEDKDDSKDEDRPGADPNSLEAMSASLYRSFRFQVTGVAKAQTAVSRFVLRLEKIGLFDEVKMIKTSRRSFLESRAIGFEVECLMNGKEVAHR